MKPTIFCSLHSCLSWTECSPSLSIFSFPYRYCSLFLFISMPHRRSSMVRSGLTCFRWIADMGKAGFQTRFSTRYVFFTFFLVVYFYNEHLWCYTGHSRHARTRNKCFSLLKSSLIHLETKRLASASRLRQFTRFVVSKKTPSVSIN